MNSMKKIFLCSIIGLSILFTGCEKEPETVTDIDGNVYNTVTIGTQVWLKENLRTTKLNDGTEIPYVTSGGIWAGLSTPGYCYYDNSWSNAITYGALYNWHTVNTGKLCPTGWHVPSNEEWETLITYLGGDSLVGGKLKETGTAFWESPNRKLLMKQGLVHGGQEVAMSGEILYTLRNVQIFGVQRSTHGHGMMQFSWDYIQLQVIL